MGAPLWQPITVTVRTLQVCPQLKFPPTTLIVEMLCDSLWPLSSCTQLASLAVLKWSDRASLLHIVLLVSPGNRALCWCRRISHNPSSEPLGRPGLGFWVFFLFLNISWYWLDLMFLQLPSQTNPIEIRHVADKKYYNIIIFIFFLWCVVTCLICLIWPSSFLFFVNSKSL